MANPRVPLDPSQVASLLRSTPAVLQGLVQALPRDSVAWHPSPGKWCVKEIIGHLTEEDTRDFAGRIQLMLNQDEPILGVNDQDEVARLRHDCDRDLHALLDEFHTVRDASVAFVLRLREGDLRRGAVRPGVGRVRIDHLLHEWVYHDLNHLSQIRVNAQRFLWPHLGNLQRLYQA